MSITSTASPRWGRIPHAVGRTGISKGKLYQLAPSITVSSKKSTL
jgi:hypothetical protein